MAWAVLVISGVFEAVWAIALGASNGFRRLVPVLVFILGTIASLGGLAYAMTELPAGTAYAVWIGIGATVTVLWSTFVGDERMSTKKALLLTLLIGSVGGLKAVS
ncbi:DMT family transporter [Mycolicibacterium confluentis]|uniref:QacE family quaternary ammonium compound efflux SMR transporter n=1 Tax=Mycolicibacterium confluentis TaxID=28047 RepID=A0A7I7XSL3_9MYCO|nr:SMR family transporter [Mycolicibacterium confluentis]MCV7321302.1 QacE family quaternary ammonium compound efflux SMR transporter [Mycolicibacterium confluentis]ORV25226.1 ligand-binding protein SH3 [Mycolicibacterium confluentis]BBZ32218.1 QacE family quaternary ammonium compound efflux SMR transporter [Mycolicibacterium confluentis]